MRDLITLINEIERFKEINAQDVPQVIDALKYAINNMPSDYKMEEYMEHKECLSTDECQQDLPVGVELMDVAQESAQRAFNARQLLAETGGVAGIGKEITAPLNPIVNGQEVEPPIETKFEKSQRLVSKIISINATLEAIKPLYAELDLATLELMEMIGLDRQLIEAGTQIGVQVVDEFAEKNIIWRIQKSQRFIAKLETLDERNKKFEKERKALEKASKVK